MHVVHRPHLNDYSLPERTWTQTLWLPSPWCRCNTGVFLNGRVTLGAIICVDHGLSSDGRHRCTIVWCDLVLGDQKLHSIQMPSLSYWCQLVLICSNWCTFISIGAQWCTLVSIGVGAPWFLLVPMHIQWNPLVPTGSNWCTFLSIGAQQYPLGPTGLLQFQYQVATF